MNPLPYLYDFFNSLRCMANYGNLRIGGFKNAVVFVFKLMDILHCIIVA